MIQFSTGSFYDPSDHINGILSRSHNRMTTTRIRPKKGKSQFLLGSSLKEQLEIPFGRGFEEENGESSMKGYFLGFRVDTMRLEFGHGPENIIIIIHVVTQFISHIIILKNRLSTMNKNFKYLKVI